jgi:hypothetical protein
MITAEGNRMTLYLTYLHGSHVLVLIYPLLVKYSTMFFSHYSALVEDLISILLRVDATKRPSARQILCIPVMQPNVDAYVTRMHHLHGNVCNSIATMSILEKRENPDPLEGKCHITDDEKENVSVAGYSGISVEFLLKW